MGILAAYPFLMTAGTMGVGEKYGARSANRGEAYLYPTLASLGGVAVSAAAGNFIVGDDRAVMRLAVGVFVGTLPNAFLNAYVYNRVKEPEAAGSSSLPEVTPFVALSRGDRESPTPVWGVTVFF
jgi:hypothetical protein